MVRVMNCLPTLLMYADILYSIKKLALTILVCFYMPLLHKAPRVRDEATYQEFVIPHLLGDIINYALN